MPPPPGITTSCRASTGSEALLAEVEHSPWGITRARWPRDPTSARRSAAPSPRSCTSTRALPVDYILKADLRIDGGEFRQNLQGDGGMTTGRLDSRFSGPDIDPLSQRADYDPQAAALSSAYVSAFNEYARKDLHYGEGKAFKPSIPMFRTWNFQHQLPGQAQRRLRHAKARTSCPISRTR